MILFSLHLESTCVTASSILYTSFDPNIFLSRHTLSSPPQWSYGVLLWELTTLAQQPYVEVAACEMAEYLRDGYRLAQPLNCPDDLYKVMAFCWAIHPHDRPHAKLILDYLAAFHQQLNSFI